MRLPTLSKLEMKILMVLYRKGGAAKVKELRDETGAGSLFYPIVGKLSLMGLVEELRVSDVLPEAKDSKRMAIRLTERGRKVAELLWMVEELVKQGLEKGG